MDAEGGGGVVLWGGGGGGDVSADVTWPFTPEFNALQD